MEQETVDFHLKQATVHIEMALQKSKTLFDDEEAKSEIERQWTQFLSHMFEQSF